jgi:hypothetical protein
VRFRQEQHDNPVIAIVPALEVRGGLIMLVTVTIPTAQEEQQDVTEDKRPAMLLVKAEENA